MSYFAPYLDEAGLHLPTYEERLENLCEAYRSIFGQEAELSPAVPDYQLLSVLAKALDDASALLLQVYNSRNPAYAQGQALDLLMPQYGLVRRGATSSKVTLQLSGAAGTVVPAGSMAATRDGQIWVTEEDATILSEGAAVTAACSETGPIYTGPGTVTEIVSPVAGWSGVTNPEGSSIGLVKETDAEARARIVASMAERGTAAYDAIAAGIAGIANVRNYRVYVNEGDEADDNGIPGHSIACVVYGGNQELIARKIYELKAPGIGSYGSVTVQVADDEGDEHGIQFSRPTARLTYFLVSLRRLDGFDETLVENAIAAELREIVNEVRIGDSLNIPGCFGRCYGAAGNLASTFIIRSIQATAAATAYSEAETTTEYLTQGWCERFSIPSAGRIQFVVT